MAAKLKILTMALAIACVAAFAGGDKDNKKSTEEWKAYKECKQRIEKNASEDCSALKPANWKKDKKSKKDGKKCHKKDD